jgi:XamI restriction endonuclease
VVNADKPLRWKEDVTRSVDFYNTWFIRFAPATYRQARTSETEKVVEAFKLTKNLTEITPEAIKANPFILPILRMVAAPPIARDRLIGLSGVQSSLVDALETRLGLPPKMPEAVTDAELTKVCTTIQKLIDVDLFPWLLTETEPDASAVHRGATVVADRVSGMLSNPIIRNAQEERQLATLKGWLEERDYHEIRPLKGQDFRDLPPGSFCFRLTLKAAKSDGSDVNIPVDVVLMPLSAISGDLPLLIEAKSAGDFTNTNKRRKEEAVKADQLRRRYGTSVRFVLFLCGYFGTDYLGYEAAEGIDWFWEHRLADLEGFL